MQTNTEKLEDSGYEEQKNSPSALRLKKLKEEIISLNEKEHSAEKKSEYKDLNNLLSFARFILRNNPSQEEIAVSKKLIEDLKFIKDSTKTGIENLKDELLIADDIKSLLANLNKDISETVGDKDNKKPLKDKLKESSGKPKLEMIFLGAETELVKGASKLLLAMYSEKLKKYKLSPDELENISIGVTQKMLEGGVFGNLAGGLSGKLETIKVKAADGKWTDLIEEGGKMEIGSTDILKNLEKSIDSNMAPIITKLEENPKDPFLSKLLSNPKEISSFNNGKISENIKSLSQDELIDYLSQTNSKILELDKKLLVAQKMKDNIFDSIATAPGFMRDGMMKFLGFLMDLPIIGDLIKGFLGISGTKEEVLNGVSEEILRRKSVIELRKYGKKFDKDGNSVDSEKNPGIEILKNKDLRNMNINKLEGMFKFCKANGINTNDDKFWETLFSGEVIFKGKDAEGKEKQIKLNKLNIKESDFGIGGQPSDSFYNELNSINEITSPVKAEEKTKPKEATPIIVTPTAKPKIVKPKESKAEEKTPALPETVVPTKEVKFNKEKSELVIDGKTYKVSLKKSGFPVNVDNMEYKNGTLLLAGSLLGNHSSKLFSEKEVLDAFSKLEKTGRFSGGDDVVLTIEKA